MHPKSKDLNVVIFEKLGEGGHATRPPYWEKLGRPSPDLTLITPTINPGLAAVYW